MNINNYSYQYYDNVHNIHNNYLILNHYNTVYKIKYQNWDIIHKNILMIYYS